MADDDDIAALVLEIAPELAGPIQHHDPVSPPDPAAAAAPAARMVPGTHDLVDEFEAVAQRRYVDGDGVAGGMPEGAWRAVVSAVAASRFGNAKVSAVAPLTAYLAQAVPEDSGWEGPLLHLLCLPSHAGLVHWCAVAADTLNGRAEQAPPASHLLHAVDAGANLLSALYAPRSSMAPGAQVAAHCAFDPETGKGWVPRCDASGHATLLAALTTLHDALHVLHAQYVAHIGAPAVAHEAPGLGSPGPSNACPLALTAINQPHPPTPRDIAATLSRVLAHRRLVRSLLTACGSKHAVLAGALHLIACSETVRAVVIRDDGLGLDAVCVALCQPDVQPLLHLLSREADLRRAAVRACGGEPQPHAAWFRKTMALLGTRDGGRNDYWTTFASAGLIACAHGGGEHRTPTPPGPSGCDMAAGTQATMTGTVAATASPLPLSHVELAALVQVLQNWGLEQREGEGGEGGPTSSPLPPAGSGEEYVCQPDRWVWCYDSSKSSSTAPPFPACCLRYSPAHRTRKHMEEVAAAHARGHWCAVAWSAPTWKPERKDIGAADEEDWGGDRGDAVLVDLTGLGGLGVQLGYPPLPTAPSTSKSLAVYTTAPLRQSEVLARLCDALSAAAAGGGGGGKDASGPCLRWVGSGGGRCVLERPWGRWRSPTAGAVPLQLAATLFALHHMRRLTAMDDLTSAHLSSSFRTSITTSQRSGTSEDGGSMSTGDEGTPCTQASPSPPTSLTLTPATAAPRLADGIPLAPASPPAAGVKRGRHGMTPAHHDHGSAATPTSPPLPTSGVVKRARRGLAAPADVDVATPDAARHATLPASTASSQRGGASTTRRSRRG